MEEITLGLLMLLKNSWTVLLLLRL